MQQRRGARFNAMMERHGGFKSQYITKDEAMKRFRMKHQSLEGLTPFQKNQFWGAFKMELLNMNLISNQQMASWKNPY